MRVSSAVVCILYSLAPAVAFVPQARTAAVARSSVVVKVEVAEGEAKDSKTTEKLLREELAERNSKVENEEKYAVVDGSMANVIQEEQPDEIYETTEDRKSLEASIARLVKPRAYPLFLAEKAAEIVEGVADGFQKGQKGWSPNREKVVVLGTGWGAASFLKDIDTSMYDVTVVSPRNYFVFTPMLAGASVGTVEYRSITEPIREINRKVGYLEGTAMEIDPKARKVICESVVCDGNSCDIEDFEVEYDRLVVTIGAQTNTFGIPGVREYCNFLKQVEDARRIRTAIVNCFERANLPDMTEEERINNLTFAVIGAGPTGIEFAAELRDFVEQDGPKYYPNLLKYVRIKVIEASSTVLAPFDQSLQEEAIEVLNRQVQIQDQEVRNLLPPRFQLTQLLLDSSVKEVTDKTIQLNDGNEIHYGLAVWAAGNGPLPLTLDIIDKLGEGQSELQNTARGRIATDYWLRAEGSEGRVIAFGDCSCNTESQLPATAQVAAQQGEYLAGLMNKKFDLSPTISPEGVFLPPARDPESPVQLSEKIANFATQNDKGFAKPFQFLNLGILAYTGGGSALAQVSPAPGAKPIKGTGKVGNALWRSVYLTKQVSWRNRALVVNDWLKRKLFGRDITRV